MCYFCCMRRDAALRALEDVAADQAGLVTAAQATARGVERVTQRRLATAGLLEHVGRGVYRLVGAPPPQHLELRTAWLRLDPATPAWERDGLGTDDGVVSHRSACLLHDLGDIPTPHVELTVPRRRTTREPGVRLHQAALNPAEVTIVDGLPVTTVERTIMDLLRGRADGAHVGAVLADAERRGLLDPDHLAEHLHGFARHYGLHDEDGTALIAALVEQAGGRSPAADARRDATLAQLAGIIAGLQLSEIYRRDLATTLTSVSEPASQATRQPPPVSVNDATLQAVLTSLTAAASAGTVDPAVLQAIGSAGLLDPKALVSIRASLTTAGPLLQAFAAAARTGDDARPVSRDERQ